MPPTDDTSSRIERAGHPVYERLNIIFIDPEYMNESVPHDHKLIDRELKNSPIQFRQEHHYLVPA